MNPSGSIPLVGPWLYRRSFGGLARRAAAGDTAAAGRLAAAFCTAPDPGTRKAAGEALRACASPGSAALLCSEALLSDNPDLLALVQECGLLPPSPADAALFRFCTAGSAGISPGEEALLATGYGRAPARLRERARAAARRNGTAPVLARALCGTTGTPESGSWTPDEWDMVISGLISAQRCGDLWFLAPGAPPAPAFRALSVLKTAGWIPPGDDGILWRGIAEALPDGWTWPVPALSPMPVLKPGGQVRRIAFSRDGSLVATGSSDGIVTCRRMTGGPAEEFSAGEGPVGILAFSPVNDCLAVIGGDGTIRGCCIPEQPAVWTVSCPGGAACLAFSPAGPELAAGDGSGRIHRIDARDGRVLSVCHPFTSPVTSLAHGGGLAASGYGDGTIALIRTGDDPAPVVRPGTGSPVRMLGFRDAGTRLLAVFEQGPPVLIDTATIDRIRDFSTPAGRTSCSMAPGGCGWFIAGCDDHAIRCWNTGNARPADVHPLYSRTATAVSAVPDGRLLAAGFQDGIVRIYGMPGFRLVREFRGHQRAVISCSLSPDGTRLATASWDGTAVIWRIPEADRVRTFDARSSGIAALAGPASGTIAAATVNGTARILAVPEGRLLRTIDLYTPVVRALALSPDGAFLAGTGADASVRLWDTRDGSLAGTAASCGTSQYCCAFLPGEPGLVTGGWDGNVRIFRVPDLNPLYTLRGHTSTVTCCAVSRDGNLLATGSNDTTVRLWNLPDNGERPVIRGSRAGISCLALSPDGIFLAAGGDDGTVRLFRLPYGTPAGELPALASRVTSLAFAPDGGCLAAGSALGLCTLFSTGEPGIIRTFEAHAGPVTGIVLLPDGKTMVTAGGDGSIRFHALPVLGPLCQAELGDICAAAAEEAACPGTEKQQWTFLRILLSARFRNEIGICPLPATAGKYDIQLAG